MSGIVEKKPSDLKSDLAHRQLVERASKQLDLGKNPCIKEQEMSFRCLDDNGYDRDKCSKHFQNYKNCREFWSMVQSDRKRKGIKPYLPAPEDRPNMFEQYKQFIPWK